MSTLKAIGANLLAFAALPIWCIGALAGFVVWALADGYERTRWS